MPKDRLPDPEDDFDAFMDALPLNVRSKVLRGMSGDHAERDVDPAWELEYRDRVLSSGGPWAFDNRCKIVELLLDQGEANALDSRTRQSPSG